MERSWWPQELKYTSWERLLAGLGPKRGWKREPTWDPKTVQNAFLSPKGSKRPPGSHLALFLESFGTHFGHPNHRPKGLQTLVCMSVAWHPAVPHALTILIESSQHPSKLFMESFQKVKTVFHKADKLLRMLWTSFRLSLYDLKKPRLLISGSREWGCMFDHHSKHINNYTTSLNKIQKNTGIPPPKP